MTNYYDILYGPIKLDDIVLDMVSKCSELKRLRFIGMMNFRSLSMLSLTTITRLEHTIGLAYLSQIFIENNSDLQSLKKDILVASLYHDVNCGSFGHSTEWAIDRYVKYEHETEVKWLKELDTLNCLKDKPMFIEQDGFHKYHFDKKYNLNLERINQLIDGKGYFFLNNSGIDLDNIDNVFRMAHYLGLLNDISIPKKLVSHLHTKKDIDNFIIERPTIKLLEEWYRLRSTVYEKFIYSSEYMGYEFLIFDLISEYVKSEKEKKNVKNLFHFTDEHLLWSFYHMKSDNPKVSNIAKRLLLYDIPKCYGILKSDSYQLNSILRDEKIRINLLDSIKSELSNIGIDIPFTFHMTTDNKKTNRHISFYLHEDDKLSFESIGEDKQYVLLAIIGERELKPIIISQIIEIILKVMEKEGFPGFLLYKQKDLSPSQKSLF